MKAVPNHAYAKARYEISFTSAAGDPMPIPYPYRYNNYAAAARHNDTGEPQPGSLLPYLLQDDDD